VSPAWVGCWAVPNLYLPGAEPVVLDVSIKIVNAGSCPASSASCRKHGRTKLIRKLLKGCRTKGDRNCSSCKHNLNIRNPDKAEDAPEIAGFIVRGMSTAAPNLARGLLMAARAHTAAVVARLAIRGYVDFPFVSASLLWLLDEGGTRSTLLAQRAGVTKQAMSQLIRLMERQGYLEQVPDPRDTRAKVVRMTPRGEAVKTACVKVREELNQQIADAIGRGKAREMETHLDAMTHIFANVDAES